MIASADAVMRKGHSFPLIPRVGAISHYRRTQTHDNNAIFYDCLRKTTFFLDTKWRKLMYSQIFQNIANDVGQLTDCGDCLVRNEP